MDGFPVENCSLTITLGSLERGRDDYGSMPPQKTCLKGRLSLQRSCKQNNSLGAHICAMELNVLEATAGELADMLCLLLFHLSDWLSFTSVSLFRRYSAKEIFDADTVESNNLVQALIARYPSIRDGCSIKTLVVKASDRGSFVHSSTLC